MLSNIQQDRLQEWLKEKAISRLCPACDTETDWMADTVVAFLTLLDGRLQPNPVYPALPLVCQNCGHIRWFMAQKIGLA